MGVLSEKIAPAWSRRAPDESSGRQLSKEFGCQSPG